MLTVIVAGLGVCALIAAIVESSRRLDGLAREATKDAVIARQADELASKDRALAFYRTRTSAHVDLAEAKRRHPSSRGES